MIATGVLSVRYLVKNISNKLNSFFNNKRKISLGAKFASLVAIILVLTMSAVATFTYRAENSLFLENLQSKGRVLGTFIASVSPQPILSYDYTTLNDYVREVSHKEDVIYAVILAPDNKNLTAYLDSGNAYIKSATETLGHNNILGVIQQVKKDKSVIPLEFPIALKDQKLGMVEIGISRKRIDALSRKQLAKILLANVLIIIFLITCIYIIFRRSALEPIRELIMGSDRVAGGDLEHKVAVGASDELGTLTDSFNEMIGKLKKSTNEKDQALKKLQDLNKTLESRVERRTRELESANKELKHIALHDELTSLPNRSLIFDRVVQAIEMSKRQHEPFTIMMMDLNRFKDVNDTLGHDVGDKILRDVGSRLKKALRHIDTVGRLGGDEFAIIFPGVDEEYAVTVANKLVHIFNEPFEHKGMSLSIGTSIGIAIYPQHGDDTLTLLKRADVAMYVAKSDKCGYFIYDAAEDKHSTRRLALTGELHNAIQNDNLVLHYQPIIELASGNIVRAEALVRWLHPERGLILPADFIPLMEQTGFINMLSQWVLINTFKQQELLKKSAHDIGLAVNLSIHNLKDPEFSTKLFELLEENKTHLNSLILEVTESAVMSDSNYVSEMIARLKKMKVNLSIDDFGVGYSSLSRLKKLPVSEVKIDRSFVIGMLTNKDDAVIVKSTIDLAHNLGLKVVAEGVENQESLDILIGLGCDMAQGTYITEPLNIDQFFDFINKAQPLKRKLQIQF